MPRKELTSLCLNKNLSVPVRPSVCVPAATPTPLLYHPLNPPPPPSTPNVSNLRKHVHETCIATFIFSVRILSPCLCLSVCLSVCLPVFLLKCCIASTETVGLLGTGAKDVHLDFHTAPELSVSPTAEDIKPHINITTETVRTITILGTGSPGRPLSPTLTHRRGRSGIEGWELSRRTIKTGLV